MPEVKICIWPDDEWCYFEDVGEYGYKSDDYFVLELPTWLEEDDYPTYNEVGMGLDFSVYGKGRYE